MHIQSIATAHNELTLSSNIAELYQSAISNNDKPLSKLEEMLQTEQPISSNATTSMSLLDRKLEALCDRTRLSADKNVLIDWESKKTDDPELYALSQIDLSIPATQVSVERAFSALGLILTKHRTCLKEQTLNNILLLKLNSDLFNNLTFT